MTMCGGSGRNRCVFVWFCVKGRGTVRGDVTTKLKGEKTISQSFVGHTQKQRRGSRRGRISHQKLLNHKK